MVYEIFNISNHLELRIKISDSTVLNDYKLNITAKQIGHKEILWFAAKSGPKCGDSVVTSIPARAERGRGDFIWCDGQRGEAAGHERDP